MNFNKHSNLEGQHAFLGASKYHWLNYPPDKVAASYMKFLATLRGTELHDFAAHCMEVIWKTLHGRADSISWTMLLLAVILAIPLERCGAEMPWHASLCLQGIVCGVAITAAELLSGLVLNVWLGLGIWDYSGLPLNFMGQICLPFFGIWCLLSIPGIVILDWLRYAVEGGERPHYHV